MKELIYVRERQTGGYQHVVYDCTGEGKQGKGSKGERKTQSDHIFHRRNKKQEKGADQSVECARRTNLQKDISGGTPPVPKSTST